MFTHLVVVLPADGGRWFGTEADHAGQVDGAAHANEHFAAAQDCGARFCSQDDQFKIS